MSAEWRLECLPEVLPAVFVRADFANPTGSRLLPGPAEGFIDGRSIGRIDFPGAPATGGALCAFGIDASVAVHRDIEPVRRLESDGEDGREHRWRYATTITLRNRDQNARRIHLAEALPISEIDTVAVDLDPATTAGYERAEDRVSWQVDLGPGAEREITLAYTITMHAAAAGP